MMEAVARGGGEVNAKQQPQSASTNTTSKGAVGINEFNNSKAANVSPAKQMAMSS